MKGAYPGQPRDRFDGEALNAPMVPEGWDLDVASENRRFLAAEEARRAFEAQIATDALDAAKWRSLDVVLLPMRLSDGRTDYYVRITCDGDAIEVRKYGTDYKNRADYEVAAIRHSLFGEPRPDILDPKYDDPKKGDY